MRDCLATHASGGLHSFHFIRWRAERSLSPLRHRSARSGLIPMGAETHVVLFLDLRVHFCIRIVRQLQPVGPHHGESIRWEQKFRTFIK